MLEEDIGFKKEKENHDIDYVCLSCFGMFAILWIWSEGMGRKINEAEETCMAFSIEWRVKGIMDERHNDNSKTKSVTTI